MAEAGHPKRRLAAILSADVVGYSRLMQDDEAATVETLHDYRAAIGRIVAQHGGRVVNAPGDNLLAEFTSAREAVRAALEIQQDIEGRNAELTEPRRMHFRIGINLGDVLEAADGTIYGDGVNIAARMEALAEAGGVCIASPVHDAITGKVGFGFDFLGEQQVKNITQPIRVYRVRAEPQAVRRTAERGRIRWQLWVPGAVVVVAIAGLAVWVYLGGTALTPPSRAPEVAAEDPVLALPKGPAIAVLPFANLSGDPAQDYFGDGLIEDIISRARTAH